jgi:cardiolipin synthase C
VDKKVLLTCIVIVIGVALALASLRLIYTTPDISDRKQSSALPKPPRSKLAAALQRHSKVVAGLSGIQFIDDNQQAFVFRRDMIRIAQSSIDVQYYMWHADITGQVLIGELREAADRGVRVRMLLDDNTTAGTDHLLQTINHHPNVEVRLFNPFMLRKFRSPNYIFDFRRVNRRMHNKSFTVDGVATIVGGRNVGDEYFNAHANFNFADMDVLARGAVVSAVSSSFDEYWNSASSYPFEKIVDALSGKGVNAALGEFIKSEAATSFLAKLEGTSVFDKSKPIDFEWVPVQLVVDDPAKGQGDIAQHKLLVTGLQKRLGEAARAIDVVTAYFVPGRIGTNYLSKAVTSGKTVRVLTNSLASNDVVPVHAGYARYRKRLLRRGVSLFELRASQSTSPKPRKGKKKLPRFGASSSSLHAKVFVMDKCRVFVGSFNFDPRSLYLNCEMGLMIESEKLGSRLTAQMDHLIETRTYRPFIDMGGRLSWHDTEENIHRMEPESTPGQRVGAWIISWLPVEWLL